MGADRGMREGLRIALVGPAYPYRGGIAHFTNRFAEELAAEHEVLICTFDRQYPELLFPGKTQMEPGDWELPVDPVRLIDSINPISWWRAGRWIGGQNPDVVAFAYWMPFFVPAYRGMLAGLRSAGERRACEVLWLHNLHPHERLPGAGWLLRALVRRFVGQMDRFVCLSESTRQELLELRADAEVMTGFHPVYDIFEEAIDPERARRELGVDVEAPTLLFFGYVRRYKGLDVLLEALARLPEEMDVQLLVAGAFYEEEAEYREQARSLGLLAERGPRVRFFPEYVPTEKVHLYFSAANLVVQPYRSATQSGVARTAFNFGRPVVVTDVGGLAEEVPDGEAGYVVPPEDPEALAGAVRRFFDADPGSFREGARRQAERFSWSALAEQFLAFVADCPDGADE